jgi:hypothetical protein
MLYKEVKRPWKKFLLPAAAAVIAAAGITAAVLHIQSEKEPEAGTEISVEALEGEALFTAVIGEHEYMLRHYDSGNLFFTDGMEDSMPEDITYASAEKQMDFAPIRTEEMEEPEEDQTGEDIYHLSMLSAEKWLGYLTEAGGYHIEASLTTAGYCDYYLSGPDGSWRFLYVRGSGDSGTLIFTELDGGAEFPSQLSDLL